MKKVLRIFKKKFADFQKFKFFTKLKTSKTQIFKISIIHKPSLGSLDVPQKIWARSVQIDLTIFKTRFIILFLVYKLFMEK